MCIVRERRPAGFLDMKCQTCFLMSCSIPAESALDEDAGQAKKTTKAKKKTKKSEPKDLSIFDDDAPSIFDDPLSALGNN